MRLNNPWLSPPGFLFTAIVFLFILIGIRRNGHLMFSPGALSAVNSGKPPIGGFQTHAGFEKDCQACHQPIRKTQAALCNDCHTTVKEEIENQSGTHGKMSSIEDCAGCHPDHRGRDFDLLLPALDQFDHSTTAFSLIHHQINFDTTPMDCTACHLDRNFSGANFPCSACHGEDPRFDLQMHIQDFGEDCLACHDGKDRMLSFDHRNTRFPLEGQHEAVACSVCHRGGDFNQTPINCEGCHEEPDLHAGMFDSDCSTCHNPVSWSPVTMDNEIFSHTADTRFSLVHHKSDFSGEPLTCTSCHGQDDQEFRISTCVTCHEKDDAPFIESHQVEFGTGCMDCHDGLDRMQGFDHANVFLLDGAHAEIECQRCHIDQQWAGLSTLCADCHAEPEIHFGLFGLKCEYCHGTDAWTPAQLKIHIFPLDHGDPPAQDCVVCHLEKYSEYTCYGCHEHQEKEILESHREAGIAADDIPLCKECHPTGIVGEARQ